MSYIMYILRAYCIYYTPNTTATIRCSNGLICRQIRFRVVLAPLILQHKQ